MNSNAIRLKLLKEIIVLDRRNSAFPVRSKHRVTLVQEKENVIVFRATWKFPVPAIRRRYFIGRRRLTVEEQGKVPRENCFQFAGVFLR